MRLLVINISSSSLEINKLRRLLPAISVTTCGKVVRRCRGHNTWSVAALTVHSEARYRLRIAISAYPTCLRRPHYESSRRNIAMPFGTEELEWLGYPRVKKNWRYIIRFDRTHERYRQTHRQTDTHDGVGRAYAYHRAAKITIFHQYLALSRTWCKIEP